MVKQAVTDEDVAELMADLEAAVAERKANYRHTPVKQRGVYLPPVLEVSLEQLEEQAAIDEYEGSGQAWNDRLAAQAKAKRDGLVGDTHYNNRPGIDRRLFG